MQNKDFIQSTGKLEHYHVYGKFGERNSMAK